MSNINGERPLRNPQGTSEVNLIRGLGFVVLLAALALVVIYWAGQSHIPDKKEQPLPQILAETEQGEPVELENLTGKITVLHLYDTQCTGKCQDVFSVLFSLDQKYSTAKDIRFISMRNNTAAEDSLALHFPKLQYHDYLNLHLDQREMVRLQTYLGKEGVHHSGHIYLLDSEMVLRGTYDGTNIESIKIMSQAIRALMEQ